MGKADLSKSCWNPKRKFGDNHAFLEITEPQFGKEIPYTILYFKAF